MSRLFNGVSDQMLFASGASANLPTGAYTFAVLWKPNALHDGGIVNGLDANQNHHIEVNPEVGGTVRVSQTGFTTTSYAAYVGQWALLVFTKPAGNSVVRTHLYRYDTATWAHADLGSINDQTAVTRFFVGIHAGTAEFLNANLAAIGMWTGTVLADATLEASGMITALSNWVTLAPTTLWRFNQDSTSVPVFDLMAGGADQVSVTGTTVSVDNPPGFSFAVDVNGTAAASLGPLDATINQPNPDQFLTALMDQLLLCLCEKAAAQPNPPQHCCFRVGTEIVHDAGILEDQCCEGIAYVALGDTFPSSDSFPEADIVRQADAVCAPVTWAQVFKVGIIRCSPVGDEFRGPSCGDWNAAARQNIADAQTLRQVACCMRNYIVTNSGLFFGMSMVIDRQVQGNPQGGCVERSMTITVQFPNLCDGC